MQFQFVDEPQIAFGVDTVRPQLANQKIAAFVQWSQITIQFPN